MAVAGYIAVGLKPWVRVRVGRRRSGRRCEICILAFGRKWVSIGGMEVLEMGINRCDSACACQ